MKVFKHPSTRNLHIDDPKTTTMRKRFIQEKLFLKRIYLEWYHMIIDELPEKRGPVLELGTGPGFIEEFIPDIIKSDIFLNPNTSLVIDGTVLPFRDASIRSIVMINVFHHLTKPRAFFSEITRCLHDEGRVIMIEPWVTAWSRIVYKYLHHEPFKPDSLTWEFATTGPLSGANSALPWIVFYRDRQLFEKEFPLLNILKTVPIMPFRYIMSGGVSLRSIMPGFTFDLWRRLEMLLSRFNNNLAMFVIIVLERRQRTGSVDV